MSNASDQPLLEALLDSWDRNNTILVNFLRALPAGGLDARAMESSPSIAELFTHHHGQMKLALKVAGRPLPDKEAGPLTWRVWMNKR